MEYIASASAIDNLMIDEVEEVLANGRDSDDGTEEAPKLNGTLNGCHISANERVKRKAKRPSKEINNFDKELLNRTKSDTLLISAPKNCSKNSRKSRSFYGRGLPKKGGAGGKGTWGLPGSELLEEETDCGALDCDDPNYDEINSKDVKLKVLDLEKVTDEFTKKISTIVMEYFDHGETDEALVSMEELRLGSNRYVVLTAIIELAMDHKPSHREMASVLLADANGHLLRQDDYATGYDYLLKNLNDAVLDTPDAPAVLGNFMARSIADECIPPKFLQGFKGKITCDHAVMALTRAETLLSMKHGLVRLDNVWGVGGGTRPVRHLVKKIVLLLEEYLSSADITEATRCLTDLEVPHFHHELVYECVNLVLEKMNERTAEMMCTLLKFLCDAFIITTQQMKDGLLRIYDDMPQISLDVPLAYSVLEGFVVRCNQHCILGAEMVKKLPTRGRKRFVSEGDGGRVKDHAYF